MANVLSSTARTPLGLALDEALAASGLTVRAAALAAETTEQQIHRYRMENRQWSYKPLSRLAHVLNMNVYETLLLAGLVMVPDSARVVRESAVQQCLAAS